MDSRLPLICGDTEYDLYLKKTVNRIGGTHEESRPFKLHERQEENDNNGLSMLPVDGNG